MVGLRKRGCIHTSYGVQDIVANVFDMANDVPLLVLGHDIAQIQSQAPVGNHCLPPCPAIYWQTPANSLPSSEFLPIFYEIYQIFNSAQRCRGSENLHLGHGASVTVNRT
jgi:hypothetical protein